MSELSSTNLHFAQRFCRLKRERLHLVRAIMASLDDAPSAQRKASARASLLNVAKERFQDQQAANDGALVAPISPSPPELVDATLEALADARFGPRLRRPAEKQIAGCTSSTRVAGRPRGCASFHRSRNRPRPTSTGGDGRWLTRACELYNCEGVGYDLDPKLLARCAETCERLGVGGRVATAFARVTLVWTSGETGTGERR